MDDVLPGTFDHLHDAFQNQNDLVTVTLPFKGAGVGVQNGKQTDADVCARDRRPT